MEWIGRRVGRVDRPGDRLTGAVHYVLTGEYGPVTKDGTILFASRISTVSPGQLEGNWTGYVVRTRD